MYTQCQYITLWITYYLIQITNNAGRLGIEPRLKASKASVLPLDDLPITNKCSINIAYFMPNQKGSVDTAFLIYFIRP